MSTLDQLRAKAVTSTDRIESLADSWRAEANRRRAMSPHDVGADLLDYCASELLSELRDVRSADEELTPEEYAAENRRSISTVRRWCKTGALPARKVGRGWVIRRGTPAPQIGVVAA